jgi:hypothetical protein
VPTHGPNLRRLSISQLVIITGRAPRTISEKLRAKAVQPVGQDGRTIYYDPRQALPVLYEALDSAAERTRLDAARADAQEMKNALARGETLQSHEADYVGTALVSALKMRMMALRTGGPGCRASLSDAEAADFIEAGVREALIEVAGLGEFAREVLRRRQQSSAGDVRDDSYGGDSASEADDERVGGQGAEALA